MKTIKIAHLYYDIMNLYGENGNVRFLKSKLEEQDIKVDIYFLSLEDKIDFTKYDIFYIGSGTDNNKKLVLENILKYKDDIENAISQNKFFFITGNSYDLFGQGIKKQDNSFIDGLKIFEYTTTEEDFRIIEDQYYSTDLIDYNILGFQNRISVSSATGDSLFKVIKGTGSAPNINTEGTLYNNFYGTYLLGPLLVRNPYLTDYFVKKICEANQITYKKVDTNNVSYKAYHEFIKNFYSNEE